MTYLSGDSLSKLILRSMIKYSGNMFSRFLRSREKDAVGSTGCVYSELGLYVVDTVPAGAGVMQVLIQG